jgi:hypothetical protein
MTLMIFDETGNAIDSFNELGDAQESLTRMVREDPSVVRKLALLTFDDEGNAIGEAEVAADLANTADFACRITLSPPRTWIQLGPRTFVSRLFDEPAGHTRKLSNAAAPPPAHA